MASTLGILGLEKQKAWSQLYFPSFLATTVNPLGKYSDSFLVNPETLTHFKKEYNLIDSSLERVFL
jgi:hypothetical protein